jgi:transcriptional regulator with XRE-family HTH domain
MTRISKIAESPPAAVENALSQLGRNIRTARLRRKLSMAELAERIGISRYVLADIEKGKPTTAIAGYIGALWTLGLLKDMREVADPDRDEEGKILERARSPKTAPKRRKIDDDF